MAAKRVAPGVRATTSKESIKGDYSRRKNSDHTQTVPVDTEAMDTTNVSSNNKAKIGDKTVSRNNSQVSRHFPAPMDTKESAIPDSTITVAARVRPFTVDEFEQDDKMIMQFPGNGALMVDDGGRYQKPFTFNATFEPAASQANVFDHSGVRRLVEMAVNGYASTVFAFGQTGSGKTYTITGPPQVFSEDGKGRTAKFGLIPRCFQYLFHLMNKIRNTNFHVTISYFEIYNEQVMDLLNVAEGQSLLVRWSKHVGFYVENLFLVQCDTVDDLMAALEEGKPITLIYMDHVIHEPTTGLHNRQTGPNSVNEHSSRSHSVLTVYIDSQPKGYDDEHQGPTKHGKLTFVDLAGSEKARANHPVSAENTLEANSINRSLLVLGNCISALGDQKRRHGHIPYRDSQLTKLLADSLGGGGVTLMIACVSPSVFNASESLNTLRYANRAKDIPSRPVVNMGDREQLVLNLKKEIKILRQENHYLRQQSDYPVKPKGQLQKENDDQFMEMFKEKRIDEGRIADHGLYDMLQEYVVENETLRRENSDLHRKRENLRREQDVMSTNNDKLFRQFELLQRERYYPDTPLSVRSVDSDYYYEVVTPRTRHKPVLPPAQTPRTRSKPRAPAKHKQPQSSVGEYCEHCMNDKPDTWASRPHKRQTLDPVRTSRENGYDYVESPRDLRYQVAKNFPISPKRSTAPHLLYPTKPPHRLPEPVKPLQGYSEPRSYKDRYHNQRDYYGNLVTQPTGGQVLKVDADNHRTGYRESHSEMNERLRRELETIDRKIEGERLLSRQSFGRSGGGYR